MNCTTKALYRYKGLNSLFILFLILIITLAGCKTGNEKGQKVTPALYVDPLPSWNEGTSKESIIAFVTKITDSSGNDFIPPEDRIATFDNDGTLWCEQPMYFEFLYS
ncbi:MAG TPA: hypothetical protein PK611_09780, partial [Saprospiraceae bacterium]|nr:hypothetical protein [Saprospiraceae bacterium]